MFYVQGHAYCHEVLGRRQNSAERQYTLPWCSLTVPVPAPRVEYLYPHRTGDECTAGPTGDHVRRAESFAFSTTIPEMDERQDDDLRVADGEESPVDEGQGFWEFNGSCGN